MANFIVNSEANIAVRLSQIDMVKITEDSIAGTFSVVLKTDWAEAILFETATTLPEAQAKALPVLTALEQ
jgi:hypothetical protein